MVKLELHSILYNHQTYDTIISRSVASCMQGRILIHLNPNLLFTLSPARQQVLLRSFYVRQRSSDL